MYPSGGRGRGRSFYHKSDKRPSTTHFQDKTNHVAPVQRPIQKHDNNCCREIRIRLDLDDFSQEFNANLRNAWNLYKQSPPVESMIYQYFNRTLAGNPYEETIRLLYNCQDFHTAKTRTLPFFVIEQFQKWTRTYRNQIIHLLNNDLKVDVFKIISKQNCLALSKLIIDVYELNANSAIFLELLRCFIDRKKYKEPCQYATLFNLHTHFTIMDFLVPLILQDKLSLVDDFLKGSKEHQTKLVCYLDGLLEQRPLRDAFEDLIDTVPDVKMDKVHSRPMKKYIGRLLKMFNLSTELTPNLNRRRNEGALQFLINKRFSENTLSYESWKEMVIEAVGVERDLQMELVSQVAFMGTDEEAIWWAKFYNIEREHWTERMRVFEEDPEQRSVVNQPEESWVEEEVQEFHELALATSAIRLVDTEASFQDFLYNGLKDVDIVGIDCEWKPSFGKNANDLALMQISSRKNVFIIDIIQLGRKVQGLWSHLDATLFNNCDILKLGFNFSTDIKVIKSTIPALKFAPKQVGILDLETLWRQVEKNRKVVLPNDVQNGGQSLSLLVQICLGRPLSKSEQFSNWENRPLRNEQIMYAALDAYCLIEVYDKLKECCERANVPFEEICYTIMTSEKFNKKAKKSSKKSIGHVVVQAPSPFQNHPIHANALKVVCDTSLQGLVKNLRRCGIDTVCLGAKQDSMECVRLWHDEGRFILTKGSNRFARFSGNVTPGHCFKVKSENVDEQLKEVLDYYNVTVTKEHVFSRCQECNGNNFIKVAQSTINTLFNMRKVPDGVPAGYYDDEATGFSSDDDYYEEEASCSVSTSRKWNLYTDEKLDVGLCQTRLGIQIQVRAIPEAIIPLHEYFYVCEECGKVYWDGSHYEKIINGRLQGIVT